MTTVTFIANGKSFKTYAEARAESKFVDVSYFEQHYTPTGTPESIARRNELIKAKRAAAHASTAAF